MSVVLVTGASGLLGSRLLERLSAEHRVVAMSRGAVAGPAHAWVRGSFASPEDLRALDAYRIDTCVHLGAEVGGCSEEAGLSVNVLGTARLLRRLVDRGCRHAVLASSIGAVGCLTEGFLPRALPIDDDHPCDAVDAYGLSKALMEDVAFYFARTCPELEVAIFRIGAVLTEPPKPDEETSLAASRLPFRDGGSVAAADVVQALALAVARRLGPGARRFNLVAPTTASLYATERLAQAYGFRPAPPPTA
ncbi:MAG TPA: NAD(P)-dependent oxidoreductase [Conexibacter sp.]